MRVKKSIADESSNNRALKARLHSKMSNSKMSNSIMDGQNNSRPLPFHKSKTQNMDNPSSNISPSNRGKLRIVLNQPNESNDNFRENSKYGNSEGEEKVTIKFKSISNYKTRKGSEDIMLNGISTSQAHRDSATPPDSKSPLFMVRRENSGASSYQDAPFNSSVERRLEIFQSNKVNNPRLDGSPSDNNYLSPERRFMPEPGSNKVLKLEKLQNPESEENFVSIIDRIKAQERAANNPKSNNQNLSPNRLDVVSDHKISEDYSITEL